MTFWDTYLREHSWGKSLFLKSAILGFGCVTVLWAGWPQPSITPLDRFSSRSESKSVQEIQHQLPPVSSVANNESLRASQQGGNFQTAAVPSLVNLNVSSRKELESLPGIGKVLAGRIVTYRSIYGAFQRVNDLVKVSGIGKKRLKRLLPYVTVEAIIGDL
jgi:comEA protein